MSSTAKPLSHQPTMIEDSVEKSSGGEIANPEDPACHQHRVNDTSTCLMRIGFIQKPLKCRDFRMVSTNQCPVVICPSDNSKLSLNGNGLDSGYALSDNGSDGPLVGYNAVAIGEP